MQIDNAFRNNNHDLVLDLVRNANPHTIKQKYLHNALKLGWIDVARECLAKLAHWVADLSVLVKWPEPSYPQSVLDAISRGELDWLYGKYIFAHDNIAEALTLFYTRTINPCDLFVHAVKTSPETIHRASLATLLERGVIPCYEVNHVLNHYYGSSKHDSFFRFLLARYENAIETKQDVFLHAVRHQWCLWPFLWDLKKASAYMSVIVNHGNMNQLMTYIDCATISTLTSALQAFLPNHVAVLHRFLPRGLLMEAFPADDVGVIEVIEFLVHHGLEDVLSRCSNKDYLYLAYLDGCLTDGIWNAFQADPYQSKLLASMLNRPTAKEHDKTWQVILKSTPEVMAELCGNLSTEDIRIIYNLNLKPLLRICARLHPTAVSMILPPSTKWLPYMGDSWSVPTSWILALGDEMFTQHYKSSWTWSTLDAEQTQALLVKDALRMVAFLHKRDESITWFATEYATLAQLERLLREYDFSDCWIGKTRLTMLARGLDESACAAKLALCKEFIAELDLFRVELFQHVTKATHLLSSVSWKEVSNILHLAHNVYAYHEDVAWEQKTLKFCTSECKFVEKLQCIRDPQFSQEDLHDALIRQCVDSTRWIMRSVAPCELCYGIAKWRVLPLLPYNPKIACCSTYNAKKLRKALHQWFVCIPKPVTRIIVDCLFY